MARALRVLQIFLASPGDLQAERRAARDVVDAINRGLARELGWHVDLVGWEETLPGYSRPQERINPEVDTCELFIGLLYERWGTPTGEFSSGFEEEFERARRRREADGRVPEIWLFFKTMEPKLVRDPGNDARRVLDFRAKTVAEKKLLYREFGTTEEWERVLWSALSTELTRRALAERDAEEPRASVADAVSAETATGVADQPSVDGEPADNPPHDVEGLATAVAVIADRLATGNAASLAGDAVAVARLNLLTAAILAETRTSETYGPHEIQVAFRFRAHFELADSVPSEGTFVLRTLLTAAENVAGWYWLRDLKIDTLLGFAESAARFDAQESVRRGALALLRRAGRLSEDADRVTFFTSVLADKSVTVRRAGLHLLSDMASSIPEAEEILAALASSGDEISAEASEVLARIRAENDPVLAIAAFAQSELRIPDSALAALRARLDEIPTPVLEEALSEPSAELKAFVVTALASRNALNADVARPLLLDESPAVREAVVVAGFEGLEKSDLDSALEDFPDEGPRALFNRTDRQRAMRLAFFERLGYDELLAHVDWYSPIDAQTAYEVLGVRHFRRFSRQLRNDLGDRFESLRTRSIERTADRLSPAAATAIASQFEQYDDSLREWFIIAALRGLLANGTRRDAPLARTFLSSTGLQVRETALEVLAKVARPEDVELLEEAALTERDQELGRLVGAAALRMATRDQLGELRERFLSSGKPDLVRLALETRVTVAERSSMVELAKSLTYHDDESTRKEATRYLVERLPHRALEEFLDGYPGANRYFYNVVCWLDRILYAPEIVAAGYRMALRD